MSGRTVALDWEARYQAERTPWERPTLNPAFVTWRTTGVMAPCRILLPGAGRSGEPVALARDGFDVTVVDLTDAATAVQRVRMHSAGLTAEVVQADLLAWIPARLFDAVYDQTCLCALPPAVWPDYVARLHSWLRPGGLLFILFMQTGSSDGPPFDNPPERMRGLFGAGWRWPQADPTRMTDKNELPVVLNRL